MSDTINGTPLTLGESMTLRVALENFAIDLQSGLGDDEVGKSICEGYKRNLTVLRQLLHSGDRVV